MLDLTDPLARPLARFRRRPGPAAPGEIAVSPAALRHLRVGLGDAVATADGTRVYTVVGVVEFADDLGPVLALHPAALPRTVSEAGQHLAGRPAR